MPTKEQMQKRINQLEAHEANSLAVIDELVGFSKTTAALRVVIETNGQTLVTVAGRGIGYDEGARIAAVFVRTLEKLYEISPTNPANQEATDAGTE